MGWDRDWLWGWKTDVPVAEQRRSAMKRIEKLQKKGRKVLPVVIGGKAIASTFWGKAWCANLEVYSDYSNRIPRGRTYVRNGSVVDLQIRAGLVQALVSGSDLYNVEIKIKPLPVKTWKTIREKCAGQILSLPALLRGTLPRSVMEIVTRPLTGLFPSPREIAFNCSCPDWASMCKHVAAVLYGVGARLDHMPELLFELRGVDHQDLIAPPAAVAAAPANIRGKIIAESELEGIFGIDIATAAVNEKPAGKKPVGRPQRKTVKTETKKNAKKKVAQAKSLKKEPKPHTVKQQKTRKVRPKAAPSKNPKPWLPEPEKIDSGKCLLPRSKRTAITLRKRAGSRSKLYGRKNKVLQSKKQN